MTDFERDLSSDEIDNLIRFKLVIYGNDFMYEKAHNVEFGPGDIEYDAYIKYHNLDYKKHKMFQYMGTKNGRVLYRFFNIKNI